MSLRTILLSILFLSCASIGAQESVDVLIVHQSDAKAKRLAIAAIDSITFAESGLNHSSGNGVKDSETSPSMLVYQSSALLPLSFPIVSIEWMDFTTVPATEFYPSIDLGLSVRWASFNIGATHPEELEKITAYTVAHKHEIPFLIPGVSIPGVPGGQGGDAKTVLTAIANGGGKRKFHVLNSSSGLNFAYQRTGNPANFASDCIDALEKLAEACDI